MKVWVQRTKAAARVGDWVRTEGGRIFEVEWVVPIKAGFARKVNYGPRYVGANGESALACAVVEIRRR